MAARAHTLIKRRVVRLELQPGQEFSESELAASLGMGQTPVREALGRLRLEGLVKVEPRSGYRVAPVTLKDARDLFALRALLEGEAAALAASNPRDLDSLRALLADCSVDYDPADPESIEAYLATNREFHSAIAAAADNERLYDVFVGVLEHMERFFHLGIQLTSRSATRADDQAAFQEQHRELKTELVLAIAQGEEERARSIAVEQSALTGRMVIEAMLRSDAVTTANVVSDGSGTR